MNHYRFNTGNETIELPLQPDIRKICLEAATECNFSCVACIHHSCGKEYTDVCRHAGF